MPFPRIGFCVNTGEDCRVTEAEMDDSALLRGKGSEGSVVDEDCSISKDLEISLTAAQTSVMTVMDVKRPVSGRAIESVNGDRDCNLERAPCGRSLGDAATSCSITARGG